MSEDAKTLRQAADIMAKLGCNMNANDLRIEAADLEAPTREQDLALIEQYFPTDVDLAAWLAFKRIKKDEYA
jgi:hypothetical protein